MVPVRIAYPLAHGGRMHGRQRWPHCGCLVAALIVTFPRPLPACHNSERSQPPRSPMGWRGSTLVSRRRASQEATVCRGGKQQHVLLIFSFGNCQGSENPSLHPCSSAPALTKKSKQILEKFKIFQFFYVVYNLMREVRSNF